MKYLLPALLLAAVAALYFPALGFDFAYDDLLVIQHNPLVAFPHFDLNHLSAIALSPMPPGNLYRPLSILSYWFDYQLAGLSPAWFHGVNIALYGVLCFLSYRLFLVFLPSAQHAGAAALLFVIHPMHVEAVANVVGRAELLSAIFGMGSILLALRADKEQSYLAGLISALLLFLALSSKESGLVFAVLIFFALAAMRNSGWTTRTANAALPYYLVAVLASLILRYAALGDQFLVQPESSATNPENPLLGAPLSVRLIPALKIIGDYLIYLICPINLSPDYSLTFQSLMAKTYSVQGALSFLILFAYLAALFGAANRKLLYLGLWFLISFALTANVLLPIGTIRADRLALVPSIGLIGFIVGHISDLKRPAVRLCALLVFVTYSLATFGQLWVWQSTRSVFESMLERDPENPKALYNYGMYLYSQDRNHRAAAGYLLKTLELVPDHLYSMRMLADIALAHGDVEQLEYWYRRILSQYPDEVQAKRQLEKLQLLKTAPSNP